jgi:type II secretory pathway pseudopilin PulG
MLAIRRSKKCHRSHERSGPSPGYSLIELMFAVGLVATAGGAVVPQLLSGLDNFQTFGAARYMASRLQQARMDAISRSANVAMRFIRDDTSATYAVYQDGNSNGVLSRDIQRGLDPEIHPFERLESSFLGVQFGTLPNLPAVDGSGTPPGSDPIRLGSSDMVSFTALGTSTSGSLYIRGRGNVQYAVRIFGETGRIRVLRFDSRNRQWVSL